jgi:5-carboxymethyl-2-hydroxymuconate isomerase
MPHVKLEYTENVQWKNPIQDIFPKLQTVLIQHARVKPENCKSRATELKDFYCTGKNHSGGFIHLGISLLSGRTEEVKTNIGKECRQIIQSFIKNIAEIQVSVELRDMDRGGYFTTNQL